jgi:hypothetical protein
VFGTGNLRVARKMRRSLPDARRPQAALPLVVAEFGITPVTKGQSELSPPGSPIGQSGGAGV